MSIHHILNIIKHLYKIELHFFNEPFFTFIFLFIFNIQVTKFESHFYFVKFKFKPL